MFACFTLMVTLLCTGAHSELLPNILKQSDTDVQVYALPVGQGDCTIIQCPSSGDIIVFDCGSSGGKGVSPNYVQSFLGSSIDKVRYILISHYNEDHYNYLYDITWNRSSVAAVIIGGKGSDYQEKIGNWLNDWKTNNKLYMVNNGEPCIGSTNCKLTNAKDPSKKSTSDFCSNQNIQFNILATNVLIPVNQKSIVMKIIQGGWSMLLSGDIEGKASVMIADVLGPTLQSTVYKMSHHGASSSANKIEWLRPIKPTFAFASNGYAYGRCRHPRCTAIDRLLEVLNKTTTIKHDLYCGGNKSKSNDINDPNFQYNILETSPKLNLVCFLIYTSHSEVQPSLRCGPPPSTLTADPNDRVFDDECLSLVEDGIL